MKQALLVLLFATPAMAQYTAQMIPSVPLNTFQNSLGINVHMEYSDGLYVNEPQVLSDLKYLGITHVRDGVPLSTWAWQGLPDVESLMAAGIKFDLVNSCFDSESAQFQQATALEQEYPGSVVSMEGTNEVNNQPCPGSASAVANATSFQQQLYNSVHGSQVFSGIPVLYYTGNPSITNLLGLADATNTHPYPSDGVQPFARLQSDFQSLFVSSAATAPQYITETGYQNQYAGTTANTVDNSAQAELLLNTYFDAALQGVKATYLYQLLEAYPASSSSGSDAAFGLFDYSSGSPLPAAQAIHRLAQYLPPDTASNQQTVSGILMTNDSNGELVSMPSTAHSLALTKSNGDVYVCSWNEQSVWNDSTGTRIDNYPSPLYIQVPGSWSSVDYFALDGTGVPGFQDAGYYSQINPAGNYDGAPYYKVALLSSPGCVGFHK